MNTVKVNSTLEITKQRLEEMFGFITFICSSFKNK